MNVAGGDVNPGISIQSSRDRLRIALRIARWPYLWAFQTRVYELRPVTHSTVVLKSYLLACHLLRPIFISLHCRTRDYLLCFFFFLLRLGLTVAFLAKPSF